MKILSFDLGTTTGWCVFSSKKKRPIKWGKFCIKEKRDEKETLKIDKAGKRFNKFERKILKLLKKHKPTFIAAEYLTVFRKNHQTALYLAALQGILIKAVWKKLIIPVCFYMPMQGRIAVLGKGKGNEKKWIVLKALNKQYKVGLKKPTFTDNGKIRNTGDLDISDAMAIGKRLLDDLKYRS